MTPDLSLDVALRAPVAVKLPERSQRDLRIDDAWHRMVFATTPESRLLWGRRYTQLRKGRP